MTRYRITQDRWCWCGRPAALVVMAGKNPVEPVCSDAHGEITIRQQKRADEIKAKRVREGEVVGD